MNKLFLLRFLVVLLLLVNLGLAGFIYMHRPAHPGPDRLKFLVIEKLKLDDGQVKQYDGLIQKHRAATKTGNEEISRLKQELYTHLNDEVNDQAQAAAQDSLFAAILAAQSRIEHIHYHHFLEIRKLCRPDQLADFDALSHELSTFFRPGPPGDKRP